MKLTKRIAINLFLAVSAFAVLSCSGPGSNTPAAKTGSLKVSIPHVAPWLAAHMPKSAAAASRAFLYASKAIVEVDQEQSGPGQGDWQSVISPVTIELQNLLIGPTQTQTQGLVGTVESIPIGTYYRVKVSVFNKSTDTEPAVSGYKIGVTVSYGGEPTDVVVTCFPVGCPSIDLTNSTTSSTQPGTLSSNDEVWYAFQFAAGKQYTVTLNSGEGMSAYVFGDDGIYMSKVATVGTPATTPIIPTTFYYYVGLASGTMAGDYSLTVAEVPPSDVNPTVSITYPSSMAMVTTSSLSAQGMYSDPQGFNDVQSITVRILDSTGTTTILSQDLTGFTGGMWGASFDISSLAAASYYMDASISDGTHSSSSSLIPFTIQASNSPPNQPTQLLPANDATGRNPGSLYFSWQDTGDPDNDPRTFTLEIDTSQDFSSGNVISVDAGSGSSATVGSLAASTHYYWRVVASDGNATTNSYIWTFNTNQPPYAPTLLSPISPSATGLDPASIYFSWQDTGDPEGDARVFTLEIDTSDSFDSQNLRSVYVAENTTTTQYNFSASTQYYWRVSASDGIAGSTYSASQSFSTNYPPVAQISASSTTVVSGGSVTFYATGSYDPDGQSLTYLWYPIVPSGSVVSTESSYTLTNITANCTYGLRVMDPYGLQSEMATQEITVLPPQGTVIIIGY